MLFLAEGLQGWTQRNSLLPLLLKKATSQEVFNAAFESIQNTSGSNLFNARKKINPKTKSYSGVGEGRGRKWLPKYQ